MRGEDSGDLQASARQWKCIIKKECDVLMREKGRRAVMREKGRRAEGPQIGGAEKECDVLMREKGRRAVWCFDERERAAS